MVNREKKQKVRFWLLKLLLAISLGYVSEAYASAEVAADDEFFTSSTLLHYCCRIETENTSRLPAGSEIPLPCTCRSHYDEKSKKAVSSDFLRRYPDKGTLLQLKDTLSAHMQVTLPTVGTIPVNSKPIYLFFVCLLI